MKPFRSSRHGGLAILAAAALVSGGGSALLGTCGPFTDAAADGFCPFVLEIFYLGITTGTTPTTYDPAAKVSRLQMAAFLARTVDSTIRRGSRRAAVNQLWTTKMAGAMALTTVGSAPAMLQSDGTDVWVANFGGSAVSRVQGKDGRLLETWTGATNPWGVAVTMGRVFVSGVTSPGRLYMIQPGLPAGGVTTVASDLGNGSTGLAFDGLRLWTANHGPPGSVSYIFSTSFISVTVTIGIGATQPSGVIYDGNNIWVTDRGLGTIVKLDSAGAILMTVTVGASPENPAFDGTNLWVPNAGSNSVTIVRASNGSVLQTLTGNGLDNPVSAAFDGERILVTSAGGVDAVSLWKAADLTPLGFVPTGASTGPLGACSDGLKFWICFYEANKIARF